ncbi:MULTISPECIES: Rv1355c family protein [unclassified Gordonia (in: high G+C Gram-positive bacteria)]|uniref:Rv1355c family protein n=1 Tax=unclassified Gordonia (in: high G+C Gram-positive bacteria) TaxID=2657482 RepID=UPI0010F7FB1C|nr:MULTISPECIES: Rv1355c family protein [unclassified Gordonia (in: high G+C Gram-positive bacteria)]
MHTPPDAAATLYFPDELPAALTAEPSLTVSDITAGAARALDELLPPAEPALRDETPRYAHFPWRNALVKIPGPRTFRRLRLDRNRHKLTASQQDAAGELRIGVVGLSVGHAISLTLALEGLTGELRLADFDDLELTNMNRIPATLMDIHDNKAVIAARRISEIDPYLTTVVHVDGITIENIDEFLDGLDLVVEECDSFDVKVLVRQKCRERGIPVLMETSDGGTLDVERFDLEPDRPLFHGLAGDLRIEDLVGLDRASLTPLAVRVLEPTKVTAPMAASAIELGHTVTAWPQLGGDVLLGGATVAAAVRRLVQGKSLSSGRVRFDRDAWLDGLEDPIDTHASIPAAQPPADAEPIRPQVQPAVEAMTDRELVVYAASRAPSAGNQQPWQIIADDDAVTIVLDRTRTSTLDVEHRASAVAVGAALYNAQVAAAARGVLDDIEIVDAADTLAGRARLKGIDTGSRSADAETELDALLARGTRRGVGDGSPLSASDLVRLHDAATSDRTRLVALDDRADIDRYASIIARSDRARFLTPELHREMFAELTTDPAAAEGIDVASLDLPPAMAGMLDVLRRADVMALLDEWGGGAALGADAGARAASSSAILVLVQQGTTPADYLRGGIVAQQLWVAAERLGFAVHPMTPTFLYAGDDATARTLSSNHGDELAALRDEMLETWPLDAGEAPTIVLRLSRTDAPVEVSRRLPVRPPTSAGQA